jgi:hypothetical protein
MAETNLFEVPLLSNVANLYKNEEYIADRVLTPLTVAKTTVEYVEWDRGVTFKVPETRMAPNATPNQLDIKGTKKTITLHDDALSAWTDQREIEQGGGGLPTLALKTQALTNGILLRKEVDVAAKLTDASVITQNDTLVGAAQFIDDTSDPLKALRGYLATMLKWANVMVLSADGMNTLARHPKILEVFKYVQGGLVTPQLLASALDLEEVIVAKAWKDTAAVGQAETRVRVWGKDILLAYRTKEAPSPLMDQPTAGYLPRYAPQGKAPYRVYSRAPDPLHGTGDGSVFVKVENTWDVVVSGAPLCFLVKNAFGAP